jgi:hypothetical protein
VKNTAPGTARCALLAGLECLAERLRYVLLDRPAPYFGL